MRKEIEDWFRGPQDYYEGLHILMCYTTKYSLFKTLHKADPNSKAFSYKLKYELSKLIEMKKIPDPDLSNEKEKKKISPPEVNQEIDNWLSGSRDYDEGLHILAKYTKRYTVFKKLLKQTFNTSKTYSILLARELEKVKLYISSDKEFSFKDTVVTFYESF